MIFGVKSYTKYPISKLWRRWMLVYHFGNGLWWSSVPWVPVEMTSEQLTWDGSIIWDSVKAKWNFDQVWPMLSPTPESLVGVTQKLGWTTPTRVRMPHDEWSKWLINKHSPPVATTETDVSRSRNALRHEWQCTCHSGLYHAKATFLDLRRWLLGLGGTTRNLKLNGRPPRV
jgi:hypothetical protein